MGLRRKAKTILKCLREQSEFQFAVENALIDAGPEVAEVCLVALDMCRADEEGGTYERLLFVLAELGVVDIIPRVIRDLPHARDPVKLAYCVALLGNDEAASFCREQLESDDFNLRRRIIEGADNAAASGRASLGFRTALFEVLGSSLSTEQQVPNGSSVYSTLLTLDQGRAIALLRSPDHLNLENPNLCYILRAFIEKGVVVDPDFLRSAYAAACTALSHLDRESREAIGPTWIRDASLKGLAANEPESIRDELERALDSPDPSLRELAVDLLVEIEQLKPFYRNHTWEEYELWPHEEQVVVDLAGMLLQIRSNGLEALWVNFDPLYYRTLISHLLEIGAVGPAELLRTIASLLGVDDPSLTEWPEDRALPFSDGIQDEIQRLYAADRGLECIPVQILRYMRLHRSIFLAS